MSLPHLGEKKTIDAINAIAAAETVDSVRELMVRALTDCGFERMN